MTVKTKFKFLYIIGLILLFTSLFLDWYSFQAYTSDHKLIGFWSYNLFTEWSTMISGDQRFNKKIKPNNLSIPIEISILFIFSIIASGYSVLFKDLEQNVELDKLYPYAYLNFLLVSLNIYYIFAFPIFYLLPNKLYFPFLLVEDRDMGVNYYYSIGPGYILQILGFIMIFPYALFYYQTIHNFKTEKQSPKKVIEQYIQNVQEPLDLDRLIAKEELKLKINENSSKEFEEHSINTQPRKRKKRW